MSRRKNEIKMLKISGINMKFYHFCGITAVAVLFSFFAKKCNGELIVIGRLTNEQKSTEGRKIFCISDDDDAALVWSGPENEFDESQTTDFVWTKSNYPFACQFQNSTDCSLKWEESEHWRTVNSGENPMLPVLDYRWESFHEIVGRNFINKQRYIPLGEVKRSFGEIVFSVRASKDVHVFICEKEDPEEGPCFWMIIGGWINTQSAIRSCAKGANPWDQTLSGGICEDISFDKKYSRDIVSPYEWRTFRINYNANEKKIEIFKGTDKQPFLQGNVPEWYDVNKVSFRSGSGSRTRFHFYNYIQTTEDNAVISSKQFVQSSNKFCVKLFVGLCVHCSLIVRLVEIHSGIHYEGRIFGSKNNTFNELLDWRTARMEFIMANTNSIRVKLELVTELNRDKTDKGYWAIDRLRLCKSDATITTRSSTLTIKQVKKGNVALNWNKLTCQNLFRHEVTRTDSTSIYRDTSKLPEYLKEQTELCGSSCPILGKDWWLCNPTGCTCDRGFKGKSCNDECNNGSYGYNCANSCETCDGKSCDKVTGSCNEPKPRQVELYQSPSAIFKTPEVTTLNDTTIMVLQYVDLTLYWNCQISANLNVLSNSNPNSWQTLYPPINLKPPSRYSLGPESTRQNFSNYYTIVIANLFPNKNYKILVTGSCVALKKNNKISILTNETTFWTTCGGTYLFKIEPGDTYLTVYKRQITECDDGIDATYEISIRKVGTNLRHQSLPANFPVNLTYPPLDPFSEYEVSIADSTDLENKLFEAIVRTLEAAPGNIAKFNATPTSRTVKLEWEPPKKKNGILKGYEVSLEMVTLLGCKELKKGTPLKEEVIRKTVQTPSVTFANLHPYARYNVTLIAFTSKPGEPYLDEFDTSPTDTPTAKFSNFRFVNNFTELAWAPPEDCTTISGPLGAAILFFNSSDSMEQSKTVRRSDYTLNLRTLNLIAFTNYTVRLYALRNWNSAQNPRIYQSLSWRTPAQAPPAVTNLTIFDVDPESRTISLRWLPPVPSNGELESYAIYLDSRWVSVWNETVSETSIICQLGENFVCAKDIKIFANNYKLEVCAKNNGVKDLGCTQPIQVKTAVAWNAKPAQPRNFLIKPSISGIVNLQWELPTFSKKKIKGFKIIYQLSQTKLLMYSANDTSVTTLLERQDREYELHLKPSSEYKISLFSTNQDIQSKVVETSFWTPTAIAFADEKELQVSHNGTLINVQIPEIANITKSAELKVIVNGPITCEAHSPVTSNSNQTSVMRLIAVSCSAENFNAKQLTIGGSKPIENAGSKCHLHYGESYTVEFKIEDETVDYVKKSLKINLIDCDQSETGSNLTWLIILPILVIGLTILYFWNRKRRNTVVRTSTHDDIPLSKTMLTTDISALNDLKIESSPPYDAQEQQMSTSYSAPDVVPHSSNSSHIKVKAFEEYVKECISKNLLDPQYALYERGLTKSYEYGRLPPNVSKNRYKNLTAYDENRVVLDKLPDDPYSDYINASYIQGFQNQRAYIATQGPKPNTVIDFWRMIWQEEVRVICMLANIIENGRIKCEQYWPEIGKKLKYGEVSVSNTNHEVFADYTFRTFQISLAGDKRKVMHLHYTGWPDHGVPTYSQSLVAYLKKLRATRVGNGPVVVHCSAGVGRTGTIILCDICLKQAETDGVIDVPEVMMNLRSGRANMVDNEQQYLLAHLVISESMHPEKTQIPCSDNLPQELKKLKKNLQSDIQRLNGAVWRDRALHSSVLTDRPDEAYIEARNRHSPIENNQFNIVVVDGVKNKGQYLASKLPSSKTLAQFWKLIYEQEIELVIMLQRPNTEDRMYCEILPGEYILTPAPNLQLETIARSDDEEHFTMDKLVLTDSSDPNLETRRISVLSCKGWEPGRDGAPPPPAILVSLWMVSEKIPRKAGPAVVLCQDGITGCGLYLALSFLLERMAVERECDIISAVRAVRRFKPEFVRSVEQFNYLYDAALNYHESFQTYANFS
ncbi:receptor-type tyrosine-protein phosphatase delta-like [Athalia rosae]|uniref:receptor-type tyrosine-protein phosphatase delta-like n=1 Tax=Athalia rosae TaxID=37344 RepID=UPI00203438F8|nr:receptor-type tyrosine-protein phosphatase delta-like [Athalia rosae]